MRVHRGPVSLISDLESIDEADKEDGDLLEDGDQGLILDHEYDRDENEAAGANIVFASDASKSKSAAGVSNQA